MFFTLEAKVSAKHSDRGYLERFLFTLSANGAVGTVMASGRDDVPTLLLGEKELLDGKPSTMNALMFLDALEWDNGPVTLEVRLSDTCGEDMLSACMRLAPALEETAALTMTDHPDHDDMSWAIRPDKRVESGLAVLRGILATLAGGGVPEQGELALAETMLDTVQSVPLEEV